MRFQASEQKVQFEQEEIYDDCINKEPEYSDLSSAATMSGPIHFNKETVIYRPSPEESIVEALPVR